jgi:hypothetical protein
MFIISVENPVFRSQICECFIAAGAGTHNIDDVEVCEPGKVFKKDCNICRCSDTGITAFCTQKACGKAVASRGKRGEMD